MIDLYNKFKIPLYKNKKIIKIDELSNAFGAYCKKITLENNKKIIIKGIVDSNKKYNSILYEGKSIKFMHEKFPDIFSKILYVNENILVMEFIENNNVKNKDSFKDLAEKIAKIHQIRNTQFGFDFDTPIGGLRQPSQYEYSWLEFYSKKRLGMIFEKINTSKPMPKSINDNIENILKNLNNFLPKNPQPSLIHGDLWSGNILFNNGKLVGLIDPGIHYAHHELELAYLYWFNYVDEKFFQIYNEHNTIDKNFFEYQEIYQLYYSLLNVYLWSREYITDVERLAQKFS